MSQLSSGGRKTRIKTKKANKTLWFLVFFSIACVLITIICIFVTLSSGKNGTDSLLDSISNKSNTETAERIKLGDKAWTNGLQKEEVSYSEGDIVSEYLFSTEEPTHKYEISYEKISGLKNKKIEDAINKDIEETVISFKSALDENPVYDRICITSYITGNFSDVLSVEIDYSLIDIDGGENGEYAYKNTGLNYRLDTGEKLKFNDLFRDDVSIKSILSQVLYEAFAWEHAYSNDVDMTNNFDKTDYGYIENQTFKALSEYNKNPDIDFYFYPNLIYGVIRDFTFTISTKEFCDDLAIYTKYKADNLYESSSLQKEFYVCTDAYLIDAFEVEAVKGDNFYYEIIAFPNGDNENPDVKAKVEEKINAKLAHYYEIAEQNPDKAYMTSVIYYYDGSNDSETHYYNYNGYVSEMDLDYFRKHKDEIIAKTRTQIQGELSSYDFSDVDDKVEYYEAFSAYVNDYLDENINEEIITKEERRQQDLEWEAERAKWEAMNEEE